MRDHSFVGLMTLATLLILGGFFVVVTADESSSTSSDELFCGRLDAASASFWGSTHVIASARWSGFSSSTSAIRYQVAFASAHGSLARAFDASSSSRCLSNSQVQPDITHWHDVSASGIAEASLRLKNQAFDGSASSFLVVKAIDAQGRTVLARSTVPRIASTTERVVSSSIAESTAWANYDSVADYLNAVYGQVQLPINYGDDGTVNGNGSDDDDDDGYSAITKAGIVIATVVGPTILIALLILLLCGGASEAGFSGGGVVATEFPGVRGNLATENQATAVERSYPSTALDLNQKIEAPVADVQQQSGRTNLSNALQSKTPSDRDYRTAAGI